MLIIKRLRQAWQGKPAGMTVVVQDEEHAELVNESVVGPTSAVRELIDAWDDPDGHTHSAGTQVELDAATKTELQKIGVLGPTAHRPRT